MRPSRRTRLIGRQLALLPYGDSLLTPAAAFWLGLARIQLIIVSCAAALVWAVAAVNIAHSKSPVFWSFGALAGLSITWLTGASMIALDLYLLPIHRRVRSKIDRLGIFLGAGIRLLLMIATFFIGFAFVKELPRPVAWAAWLLLLSITSLKLFQPRSVAIYYSEQLQDLYAQYQLGAFDNFLEHHERSAAEGMPALRFDDWVRSTYAAIRREDELKRAAAQHLHRARIMQELREQTYDYEPLLQDGGDAQVVPTRKLQEAFLEALELSRLNPNTPKQREVSVHA